METKKDGVSMTKGAVDNLESKMYEYEQKSQDDLIRTVIKSVDEDKHDICVVPFKISYRDYITNKGEKNLDELEEANLINSFSNNLKISEPEFLKEFFGYPDDRDEDIKDKKYNIRVEFLKNNKFKYLLYLVCFLIFDDVKEREEEPDSTNEDDGKNEED